MRGQISFAVAVLAAVCVTGAQGLRCKYLPGDRGWPSAAAFSSLNRTVGGRLIATEPLGSVCHEPNYDADACAAMRDAWTLPQTHLTSSSSVMQSYFANNSCDPFDDPSTPCLLGNYVSYAVNVSTTADVAAAVHFAKIHNIRLVVRNTGHDFFGRSTGAGSLAIWTYNLKSTEVLDWNCRDYTGKALRIGAGVIGSEALAAASAAGLTVVSGECPTVGLAGGYTQGGGHSALSTSFGLGADQTLEFEVVTASGRVVTASPTENSDLYWALSGGGGGTYGVVTSMTVRAYEDLPVGGATLTLLAAQTSADNFRQAVTDFHALLPGMTDAGASVVYLISSAFLSITTVTAYNSTGDNVRDVVMAPFTSRLADLGIIPYSLQYTTLSGLDHYAAYMGPLPWGHVAVNTYQFGSRLIPRATLESNNDAFVATLTNLTANGITAAGSAANYATRPDGAAANSVQPAWRKTAVHVQIATMWESGAASWDDMLADQGRITNEFVPQLKAVAPDSATYLNEADFREPDWKAEFFGSNYNRLESIKQRWDPEGLFYALKGVGSDKWTVAGDGRMCPA